MIRPRIEHEATPAPRLMEDAPLVLPAAGLSSRGMGTAGLLLAGVVVLALGFAGLSAANFVADQFARAAWLGWVTAAVAAAGFLLIAAAVWRELSGLGALQHVDGLRAGFASHDAVRIMRAAADWAERVPGGAALRPALEQVNDPEAALALLRAGPGHALRQGTEALSRAAAVQVVAGIAAMPSPALDVLLVAWRGVRLVRQVAALHGLRPGLLGTLSLLRRTALSATLVGAAELAGNTVAHGLLSSPLLARLAGEAAGAGGRCPADAGAGARAAAACDPLPPA